ncbi:molybdopterin-dependent oxidoreductase [Pacificimonas sp. WHA3]|uniref:Molybdopterin-dependent oxidoreductase n=1 Tax=Pacificimonas pallii TaxID=2827236 RepID=A0ABS6SAH2_9SPHN|nr:molybdopterin-dependent oxidoreductase [Pacificimonas pallii]MBV7255382.1 molybdopterin-dependent oxidoreductase [Pacificimonas pallii]
MTSRRTVLTGIGACLMLPGCERIGKTKPVHDLLYSLDGLTMRAQRLVTARGALAREYTEADLSPRFRVNGTRQPASADYARHQKEGFANWRLNVGGMVRRPLQISLSDLRAMPTRTQITRHDCVEGWSAIGQWTGVQLSRILDFARVSERAKYVLFRCADNYGDTPYYETVDMIEARHPQTILAWGMNGDILSVAHGAPLRLRSERQLGYKHAKYVMGVEAIESFAEIGGGKGGFWEDRSGYDWWAGI